MRKVASVLSVLFLTLSLQQNWAIAVDNGNCSQVKNKLSEAESNFSGKLSSFRALTMKQPRNMPDLYMLAGDTNVYIAWKSKDPVKEIVKIANNSLNCFTSKQKTRVAKMKKESLSTYLVIEKRPLYSNREICNRLSGNDFELNCFQREVDSFSIYKKYVPILSY